MQKEQKIIMQEERLVRSEMCQILKAQEEEERQLRKSKDATYGDLWEKLSFSSRHKLIVRLLDIEKLDVFLEQLLSGHQMEFWNMLSNHYVIKILEKYPQYVKEAFEWMSTAKQRHFFEEAESSFAFDVFMKISFSRQVYMVDEVLSSKVIANFLSLDDDCMTIFFDFVTKLFSEPYERLGEKILKEISQMPPKIMARVWAIADESLFQKIFQEMQAEEICAVCTEIKPAELYEILPKSDFSLLKNPSAKFLMENLSETERRSIWRIFKEKNWNIGQIALDNVRLYFYPIVDLEDKEYILYDVLSAEAELKELYYSLKSTTEKMELIEIMVGAKSSGKYEKHDAERKFLKKKLRIMLEEKKNLQYFENLVLKDISEP